MATRIARTVASATLWIVLGCVVLVQATPGMGQDRTPRRQHVLIGFETRPGQTDQKLVRSLGGKMRYRYRVAPVIAAELPATAVARLKRHSRVAYVEADSLVWAVQAERLSWGVDRIDADEVWDADRDLVADPGANVGAGVAVAVIDSGIDYLHPDLAASYQGGWDFVSDDDDPYDEYGHGTHVSGTIAAADNDEGVIGVAPGVSLYALRVLDADGYGYTSDVIAALDWCRNNGIHVANMSFGSSSRSRALEEACQAAYDAGVLLVAAAGNDGIRNVNYPARYDSVIAVSATDQDDQLAWFSNFGSQIELAAPGTEILSTVVGGGYDDVDWSGTSMAAPHVSGAAALALAAWPEMTVAEVRAWLDLTAQDLGEAGRDNYFGYGLVDAYAATIPPAPAVLVGVEIAPPEATIAPAETQQFTATGVYDDQSTADLTDEVTWTSSDETVAMIDDGGLAMGMAEGTATIRAASGDMQSNAAVLTVVEVPPDEVTITRAEYSVRKRELTVEATSTGAPTAVLSVYTGDGETCYGQMRYDARRKLYRLTARKAEDPGGLVAVTSELGGIDVASVVYRDGPQRRPRFQPRPWYRPRPWPQPRSPGRAWPRQR